MRAALLSALLLAAPAFASRPPSPRDAGPPAQQQQPATEQQAQAPVNQSVPQPPIPVPDPTVAPLNQIAAQQAHDDTQDTASSGLRDWVIGLLTIGVAGLQWWVMTRQREVSSEQADIAREQASITKKQNEIIET